MFSATQTGSFELYNEKLPIWVGGIQIFINFVRKYLHYASS